jgi:hypothetical protein
LPRADVGIQQLQALAVTGRAFQLGGKVIQHRTMRRAELIRQRLNIQFGVSAARMTVRRDDLTASQAIAQCRVRAECSHDSLQGWLFYIGNETKTNHILRGAGCLISLA